MHELRLMWRNTRMVVLCAISAALYAAVLVPFKVVPLIPGVTELRPANAIPVVCSFLFGPAAAWGSAIGNMIGDFAQPGLMKKIHIAVEDVAAERRVREHIIDGFRRKMRQPIRRVR